MVISPAHGTQEAPGDWWPCGDYHALNRFTVPDRYPVPHIQHCKMLPPSLSLMSFLHITSCSLPKTTVTTPYDLFEFVSMPFGLRNPAQTFQRFMDQVLCGISSLYIDDILIASATQSNTLRLFLNDSAPMESSSTQTSASMVSMNWIFSVIASGSMVLPHYLRKFKLPVIFLYLSLNASCVNSLALWFL